MVSRRRRGEAGCPSTPSYGPPDCKEPVEQESPSSVTYDPKLSLCVHHFAALYVVAVCVCAGVCVCVCESVCAAGIFKLTVSSANFTQLVQQQQQHHQKWWRAKDAGRGKGRSAVEGAGSGKLHMCMHCEQVCVCVCVCVHECVCCNASPFSPQASVNC